MLESTLPIWYNDIRSSLNKSKPRRKCEKSMLNILKMCIRDSDNDEADFLRIFGNGRDMMDIKRSAYKLARLSCSILITDRKSVV